MQAEASRSQRDISSRGYERYWTHYRFMQSWMRKHTQVFAESSRRAASQCSCSHITPSSQPYDSTNVFKIPPVPMSRSPATSNIKDDRKNVPKNQLIPTSKREAIPRKKKAKRKRAVSRSSVSSSESQSNGERFHAELNEDYLEFMKKSARHRLEREAQKSKESEERMEVDDQGFIVDEKKRMAAPTEQPGMRRTHEMKMLYGEQSEKVHGMETAQQLCFQQACDKLKPAHWPNIPLRLKFT